MTEAKVFAVAAALLLVVSAAVVTGATAGVDRVSVDWLTPIDRPGAAHAVVRTLVMGGQFWLVGSLVVIVAAGRSRLDRSWRPLLVCGASVVALDSALWVLKGLSGRTSPHSGANDVLAGGTSYPSGHAATAALCLILLAAVLAPAGATASRRRTTIIWLGAGVASALVGLSTVVLGYHWASDVIGGWLVAILFLIPALRLLGRSAAEPG